MKKAYVYKVCANGRVSADLQTAICNAVDDMVEKNYIGDRSSQPITVKCYGGYKVMLFDNNGKMYSRRIDVFVPDNFEVAKPFMVDECYENPEMLTEDAMYGDDEDDEEDYDYDADSDDYDDEDENEEDEDNDGDLAFCAKCGKLVGENEGSYINGEFICDNCTDKECAKHSLCETCPYCGKDGVCMC